MTSAYKENLFSILKICFQTTDFYIKNQKLVSIYDHGSPSTRKYPVKFSNSFFPKILRFSSGVSNCGSMDTTKILNKSKLLELQDSKNK